MIRNINGVDVFVAVISAGRVENVPKMSERIGPATWIVPSGQKDDYSSGGCEWLLEDGGGLIPGRNIGLETAFDLGMPSVQLSDDLGRIRRFDTKTNIIFEEAVEILIEAIGTTAAKYAGFAPTTDERAFNPDRRIGVHHFIVGDFTLTMPSTPRYDLAVRIKEDYDFTMQHITEYGGVARVNFVAPAFKHRYNDGGAVQIRQDNPELESEMATLLLNRWKPHIRPHPK